MRTNLPVTQREYQFPGSETLLSTTDTTSQISYANAAFMRTSGYTRDELIGHPECVRLEYQGQCRQAGQSPSHVQ